MRGSPRIFSIQSEFKPFSDWILNMRENEIYVDRARRKEKKLHWVVQRKKTHRQFIAERWQFADESTISWFAAIWCHRTTKAWRISATQDRNAWGKPVPGYFPALWREDTTTRIPLDNVQNWLANPTKSQTCSIYICSKKQLCTQEAKKFGQVSHPSIMYVA